MAVTAAELEIVYDRILQRSFLQRNIAPSLCNRNYEARVQGARTVRLPVSDTVIASAAYTHGSAWSSHARRCGYPVHQLHAGDGDGDGCRHPPERRQ